MTETQRLPDPIDTAVGLTIRRFRKEKKLTQKVLATELGITFQQIQKNERGSNRISASVLVKIARILGVRPSALLPESDAPLPSGDMQFLHVRGADELLKGYAAIKSSKHRRAVLLLVNALFRENNETEQCDNCANDDL